MRIARAFAAVALLSVLAACAQPPQVDIDAARAALGAASRNSDVVTYAPDALRSAQEEMNALDAEIALQARRSALSRNYDSVAALARETEGARIKPYRSGFSSPSVCTSRLFWRRPCN